jgi:hypothetical protein
MSTLYVDNLQPNLGSRVMAAGHVVQVVSNQSNASFSSSGGDASFSNVLSATITPTSASSKIKITTCAIYYCTNTSSSVNHRFRLVRDGNPLSDYNGAQDSGSAQYLQYRTSAVNNHIPVPFNFTWINSPNTTSATTYTLQVLATTSSMLLYEGGFIFLEEIAQ